MSLVLIPVLGALLAIPGIRLLKLWSRTRLAPEGLLAIFFLGFALGIPLRLYLSSHPELSPMLRDTLGGVGILGLMTAVSAMVLFTRVVFRPGSVIARAYCGFTLVLLWTVLGVLAWQGGLGDLVHPVATIANVFAVPVFWWAFIECSIQFRRMRRQAALGLGDPLVRNRFLLWSLWTGVFAILPSFVTVLKLVLVAITPAGEEVIAPVPVMIALRLLVLVSALTAAASIWLSFFPPDAYVARIRRSDPAPG